ncbi:MAG: ATP-dependent DNA helicase RecG [Erysipelotrichaceae bacterium]|nr:ATP-dependent DNA helicase RecG [Erysipelotrichaceae bacterium]
MNELKKLTKSDNRLSALEAMHITTLNDVVMHLPYRYEVVEKIWPPDEEGRMVNEGVIVHDATVFFHGKLSRLMVKVMIEDKDYNVTIFNRHFLKPNLRPGRTVTVTGKVKGANITASNIVLKTLAEQSGMTPVYSVKEGITNKVFNQYVAKALTLIQDLDDFIPVDFAMKYQFGDKREALHLVHFPKSHKDAAKGIQRLKYEEFLRFSLTMQYIKMQRGQEVGSAKDFYQHDIDQFIKDLPFTLTADQETTVNAILNDLKQPTMMYRFLQGDVGSGKTVVGAIGLYANYLAGYQGALMAPTEVLARQHFSTLSRFFADTDVNVVLLTGSLSAKEKQAVYEEIATGEADVIVGTHALFQEKVVYNNLGFVITDEQHRFGVEQRKALKNKGENVDFLVMSATPIPRTLALSLYGDMDVSSIHTMPAGRKPIITKFYKGRSMKPFLKQLKDYLAKGGQVYVICPLIEDNEEQDLRSATQIAKAMGDYFKGHYDVALMHSHLKDEEKTQIMNDFNDNKIQILVSTTVIEVGIDVKNANMIVIYDADRFGLSQIHQLRGRIGRGSEQGYCFLLSQSPHKEAIERLSFMENHYDGFEISAYDLKMRGPGEVLGDRQSGLPTFMIGDIYRDFDILERTREDAIEMIQDYYKYEEYTEYIEAVKEKIKTGNEYID